MTANGSTKKNCGAGDFDITHKVTLKGSLNLKTHSSGVNSWGNVKLNSTTVKGKLVGGHGPDNEEACGGFPPCVNGITWTASKGDLTFTGQLTGAKGQDKVGTISGERFTDLATPSGAFRIDQVTANAANQTIGPFNGKTTLSVAADPAQPAAGDAAISATSKHRYANGCSGGREKGKLWNGKYVVADQPLTFSEEIFDPMQLTKTASASFERFHGA
jgi:hypothetical protein